MKIINFKGGNFMKDNNTKFKQIIDKKSKKFNSRKMCKYYHKLDATLNYETSYTQSILCKNVVYGAFMKVPLVRQAHNFTCGVACTMSVLRYLGYDFDTREDVLLKSLNSDPESGTKNNLIIKFLNNVEYKAKDNGDFYHPISAEGIHFEIDRNIQNQHNNDYDLKKIA